MRKKIIVQSKGKRGKNVKNKNRYTTKPKQ